MESDNIDKVFRKCLDESGFYYSAAAEKAQERIWNSIDDKKKKPVIFWPLIASAAAVVVILFLSYTFYLLMDHKNKEIAELELQVKQLQKSANSKDQQLKEQEKYIAKINEPVVESLDINKISSLPVLANENSRQIKDTVYITKIIKEVKEEEEEKRQVFISSVYPLEPMTTDFAPPPGKEKVLKTEFLFTNNHNEVKEKVARRNQNGLKFKIGNPGMSAHQSKPLSINLNL